MNATGIEKLTATEIEVLNGYIDDQENREETTDWKKWTLDGNGNPNFVN